MTDRRLGSLSSTHSAPRLSTISEYHASVFAFPCLCFVGVTKRNGGTAERGGGQDSCIGSAPDSVGRGDGEASEFREGHF
jgi:hypothetical protein